MSDWGKVFFAVRCGHSADALFLQCWTKFCLVGVREGDVVSAPMSELPQHYAADALALGFLESRCDSIMYIDDDMIFQPADVHALRDDPEGAAYDGLMGLCLSRSGVHHPIVMQPNEGGGFNIINKPEPDTIIDVGIVGLGFTLIRRSAFERVDQVRKNKEMYFQWGPKGDSEDAGFCEMAVKTGCRFGVSSRVCIGHRIKTVVVWNAEAQTVEYKEKARSSRKMFMGRDNHE